MSLFIPVYVQLAPQPQLVGLTDPVLVEVQASLHDHRQVPEDFGGSPTLPRPLPGSSTGVRQLCGYLITLTDISQTTRLTLTLSMTQISKLASILITCPAPATVLVCCGTSSAGDNELISS